MGIGYAILESNLGIFGTLEVGAPFVTVTFNSDGGTGAPAPKKYLRSATYGAITEPTKTDYEFLGWNGKNLLNINTYESMPSSTDNANTEARTFTENTVVIGLAYNNYYRDSSVASYSISNNTISMVASVGYGLGFPLNSEANKTYTLSYTAQSDNTAVVGALYYKSDGTFINYDRLDGNGDKVLTFTTPSETQCLVIVFANSETNISSTYSNIQLEEGNVKTDYQPYYITDTTHVGNGDHVLTAKWVKRAEFATDDWNTIVRAYKLGATQNLEADLTNGTLRNVELDLDHDPTTPVETAHLRIANLSKPSECNNINTMSQTACGFVVEFTDIIAVHGMNPLDLNYFNTHNSTPKFAQGANGGWEHSDMRAFLNGTIYQQGESDEVDYTGIGIIDALPTDLKNVIINTNVISGHSSMEANDSVTTDRLYLLSPKEMYGASFTDSNDTAHGKQRQLDYYTDNCPGNGNCPASIRGDIIAGHYPWYWYRSASFLYKSNFYSSNGTGSVSSASSNDTGGAAPAFRIAN